MTAQEQVYKKLDSLHIDYTITHHPAVFTIEEMDALGLYKEGTVVKNLFLRDAKGKRHFLVVMNKDKSANLKALREQIGCSALSFASEERLQKYLKLSKGAVSPLGILNDEASHVEVMIDQDLKEESLIGVHPNDNTATIWLSFQSLEKVILENGNLLKMIIIS